MSKQSLSKLINIFNAQTFIPFFIMVLILALCIVLQHISIFALGYELTTLNKDKQELQEVVDKQNLIVEELSSPAVLAQQQKRFDLNISSTIDWPEAPTVENLDAKMIEKVAIE